MLNKIYFSSPTNEKYNYWYSTLGQENSTQKISLKKNKTNEKKIKEDIKKPQVSAMQETHLFKRNLMQQIKSIVILTNS